MKTNCIICKCEVENWDIAYPEDKPQVHPIGGTAFRTYGHYGSSVFDPMDATYMEVVFCDPCLKERLEYTYQGVNEKYAEELEEQRKEQDKLLDWLLEDKDENKDNS
jgi:hypothetical protein